MSRGRIARVGEVVAGGIGLGAVNYATNLALNNTFGGLDPGLVAIERTNHLLEQQIALQQQQANPRQQGIYY